MDKIALHKWKSFQRFEEANTKGQYSPATITSLVWCGWGWNPWPSALELGSIPLSYPGGSLDCTELSAHTHKQTWPIFKVFACGLNTKYHTNVLTRQTTYLAGMPWIASEVSYNKNKLKRLAVQYHILQNFKPAFVHFINIFLCINWYKAVFCWHNLLNASRQKKDHPNICFLFAQFTSFQSKVNNILKLVKSWDKVNFHCLPNW